MTLDRLIAVLKPHKYRQIYSRKRCSYTIIGLWTVSMLIILPVCILNLYNWLLKVLMLLAVLCLLFHIVSYTTVFYTLYQNRSNVSQNVPRFKTKTLIVPISVVVISFICYVIPFVLLVFTQFMVINKVSAIFVAIAYLGVLMDAILYINFQPRIKRAFITIFKRRIHSMEQS